MKKYLFLSLIIVSVIGVSCNSFLEDKDIKRLETENKAMEAYIQKLNLGTFQKNANGIYYLVTRKNVATTAKNPVDGDEVTFHYVASILDGAKYDSTSTLTNKPAVVPFTANIFPFYGFYEALSMLKNGEKGIFLIPSSLAYGTSSNATIPANSMIRMDIDLLKVRSEDDQIDDYVKANNLTVETKTASGLRYISTLKNPSGLANYKGRPTTVKYVGSFLNGKTFDSGQMDVLIGEGAVIKGFDEALALMRVGEKAKFILPSAIAYGAKGTGNTIMPYTPLVFEMEIVK